MKSDREKFAAYLQWRIFGHNVDVQAVHRGAKIGRPAIYRHVKGEKFPRTSDREEYAKYFGFESVHQFDAAWREWRKPADFELKFPIAAKEITGEDEALVRHKIPLEIRDQLTDYLQAHRTTLDAIAPAVWTGWLRSVHRNDAEAGSSRSGNLAIIGVTTADKIKSPTKKARHAIGLGTTMPAHVGWLPVAAGGWVDLKGEERWVRDLAKTAGAFIMPVKGDSMEPVWHDGEQVLFHKIDLDDGPPAVGDDVMIVRNDNTATFKRVEAVKDGVITLKAMNPKYKKPMQVSFQEVEFIAWARGTFSEPRKPK
jgi:hypothetical protein